MATSKRESKAEKEKRLAFLRYANDLERKRAKAEKAEAAQKNEQPSAADWFRLFQVRYGPNLFQSPRFLIEVARPDGVFHPNDEGLAPPLLQSLPDGKEFAALREACRVSAESVAERLMVTPQMLADFEAGDVFLALRDGAWVTGSH